MSIQAKFGFEDGKFSLEYTGIRELPNNERFYDHFPELVNDFSTYLLEGAGRVESALDAGS